MGVLHFVLSVHLSMDSFGLLLPFDFCEYPYEHGCYLILINLNLNSHI